MVEINTSGKSNIDLVFSPPHPVPKARKKADTDENDTNGEYDVG